MTGGFHLCLKLGIGDLKLVDFEALDADRACFLVPIVAGVAHQECAAGCSNRNVGSGQARKKHREHRKYPPKNMRHHMSVRFCICPDHRTLSTSNLSMGVVP